VGWLGAQAARPTPTVRPSDASAIAGDDARAKETMTTHPERG
jgi:hypothetical protein